MRPYHQAEARAERHEQGRQRGSTTVLRQTFARIDLQQQIGREREDAVAPADDGGHVERREADHHDIDAGREDAGPGEPQRHAPSDGEPAGAACFRAFLERGVHGAKHRGRHDEGDGREIESLDPAHADDAGDVEGRLRQAEMLDEPAIDETDARMQQEQPTHRRGESRDQQPDRHQGRKERLTTQVRAREQPCGR
jgi:hypothetical protein